jgi:hypothetical protein
MNTDRLVFAGRIIVLLALLQGTALAASPAERAPPAAAADRLQELGEVLVSGEKPTRKVADLIPWLRRLLGQYTFEGYVDLGGKGEPDAQRRARGVGVCVGFGVAPGVQCEINVRWPESSAADGGEIMGGISSLSPAMILYGLEPDDRGIRYLQVDNRGLAEGATGFIIGDTATFRTPCVDQPEGCQRITRITAVPDSKLIEMQVDTEVNYELAMRYRFQLTRVAEIQTKAGQPNRKR